MEKYHALAKDPRIMKPLEEFLRTVREVVQSPKLPATKVGDSSPGFLESTKKSKAL